MGIQISTSELFASKKKKKRRRRRKTHEALSFRHSSVRNDTNKTQPKDQNPKQNSCPAAIQISDGAGPGMTPRRKVAQARDMTHWFMKVGQTRGSWCLQKQWEVGMVCLLESMRTGHAAGWQDVVSLTGSSASTRQDITAPPVLVSCRESP